MLESESLHTYTSPLPNKNTILSLFLIGMGNFETALTRSFVTTMLDTMADKVSNENVAIDVAASMVCYLGIPNYRSR